MSNIFSKIGTGLKDVAKFLVGFPHKLSKLITLSSDAKDIASSAAEEVITVATDVSNLVEAIAKDDGASLVALGQFLPAVESAIASRGINFVADAAVVSSITQFFESLNGTNYADVLAAVAKVVADGKRMTSVVIADFEKLKADVAK